MQHSKKAWNENRTKNSDEVVVNDSIIHSSFIHSFIRLSYSFTIYIFLLFPEHFTFIFSIVILMSHVECDDDVLEKRKFISAVVVF